jgi:hypothetical protein
MRMTKMTATMRRFASVPAIVLLSVVTTLAVQRLLTPPMATAQSSDVRATAFILVGSDGTQIARLGPGSAGDAVLSLDDSSGTLHLAASGHGDLLAYGSGGTALVQVYADPSTNNSGMLVRDGTGKLRVVAAQSADSSAAVRVQDAGGNPRVGIGTLEGSSGESTTDYGLRVRDPGGNILATVP